MTNRPANCARIFLAPLLLLALVVTDAAAQIPNDLFLQTVTTVTGRPVAVRHAGDGTNRLFIVVKSGLIRIFDLDTSTLLPTPFLEIEGAVDDSGNEQGLLGLAFHPDFDTNGYFFVNYTRDTGTGLDRTVIARYSVSAGDPDVANSGSESILLEIEQDFSNHNGGEIQFGPDGYLYIGMGDGGSGGDPNNRGQTGNQLLGKMLRIEASGANEIFADGFESGDTLAWGAPASLPAECGLVGNYKIPADNPFVADGSTCNEIWHMGMRNPWRFSFDRQTGDLFIADVGQNLWEEIDFQPASSSGGENWGWRCYEGDHEFNTSGCGPSGDYDFPILEYNHSEGCSITGGYSYRGPAIPGLDGYYAYADYCFGTIWFAHDDGGWTTTEWGTGVSTPTSFGEDEAGELYVLSDSGTLFRFEVP